MAKKTSTTVKIYRDAKTGQFTTKTNVKNHPNTTTTKTRERKKK